MSDPLSEQMSGSFDPYGGTRARTILAQLFRTSHPDALSVAAETFLQRLALLEMVLEEKGIELKEDELKSFIEKHRNDVDEETYKLAQLFFGRIASREG